MSYAYRLAAVFSIFLLNFFYWKIHVVEQLNAGATTFISISFSWYLNCFHYWREKESEGSGWKRRRERGSERRRGDKEREREKEMLENSLISCFNTQTTTYIHARLTSLWREGAWKSSGGLIWSSGDGESIIWSNMNRKVLQGLSWLSPFSKRLFPMWTDVVL